MTRIGSSIFGFFCAIFFFVYQKSYCYLSEAIIESIARSTTTKSEKKRKKRISLSVHWSTHSSEGSLVFLYVHCLIQMPHTSSLDFIEITAMAFLKLDSIKNMVTVIDKRYETQLSLLL